MKIKLAILDSDVNYLSHITQAFQSKLSSSIELHSFTNLSDAYDSIISMHIDIFLVDGSFEVDPAILPKGCGFAYLVNSPNVFSYNGQRAVCKFQKFDMLHNIIMDIYAENSNSVISKQGSGGLSLYVFTSASGGTGTSVAAISCAEKFVEMGKNTAYLNFEKFGTPALYLNGVDNFTMTDVIFAVKSKRPNLAIKLKSNIQRDTSGVYWFPAPKNPLDLQEINKEEILELLMALSQTGLVEQVIADVNFNMDDTSLALFQAAVTTIFVLDGSGTTNNKFDRAYTALLTLERDKGISITDRIAILYNKFSNKSGEQINMASLRTIGGIPRYEHATLQQIIAHIVQSEVFTKL